MHIENVIFLILSKIAYTKFSEGPTGANIVTLRKAAGLSVHDLQMVFGFNSPQAIYKWQNGTALPTVDNLIVLAALLHVRIDDILVTTVA